MSLFFKKRKKIRSEALMSQEVINNYKQQIYNQLIDAPYSKNSPMGRAESPKVFIHSLQERFQKMADHYNREINSVNLGEEHYEKRVKVLVENHRPTLKSIGLTPLRNVGGIFQEGLGDTFGKPGSAVGSAIDQTIEMADTAGDSFAETLDILTKYLPIILIGGVVITAMRKF